nr:uncharacterized protein LOC113817412 isoform X4 [Penaeus vannamei]XP_027225275.1 uncharacterized protein LOC113817412 isoform X4 [Penaeus vannamei]XP_027225276.1 uncharacterized protein LOC113817412 isoform X4 [Penaeus vannamei]
MPSASSERREGSLRRRPPLRVVVAGQALAEAVGLGAGDGQMGHCGSASSLVRARHGDGMYATGYCLTAPSLLPEILCGKRDFLYIYCEQPTFFAFDCAQYPCATPCLNNSMGECKEASASTECSIQRLNGVYVPLDKAATSVFWWPGSANKLGMEGGTIDKYHDVDSVRKQWHQIIITSHEAVLQCGITSESLNLSLHCPEDLGDDYNEYEHFMSRMFVGSYRGHEMTSSYWALGCDVTPSWCPDSAECAIPATKEKKEVQWWMKLVLAVEVIFLVIGLVWLGNGILFQVRRKRTQKREFNRQQRPTGDNKVQETKHL